MSRPLVLPKNHLKITQTFSIVKKRQNWSSKKDLEEGIGIEFIKFWILKMMKLELMKNLTMRMTQGTEPDFIFSRYLFKLNFSTGIWFEIIFFSFDDVSNFEYFVQRRSPAITAPANQSSLNPQRFLENVEKFLRVKDKIMRRRELNY